MAVKELSMDWQKRKMENLKKIEKMKKKACIFILSVI